MILKVLLFFFVLVAPTFSISLEDAIQYALKNNKDIIIQEAELELRFGEIKEFQSIYDPNLNIELYTSALLSKPAAKPMGLEKVLPNKFVFNISSLSIRKKALGKQFNFKVLIAKL